MAVLPVQPVGSLSPNPADLPNLQAIKSNWIVTLANEAAYQALHGAKPSYSVDGKSVSWDEYRSVMTEKIKALNELIQVEQGPFQAAMEMTF